MDGFEPGNAGEWSEGMKQIYKYPLEITDSNSIEMPRGAEVLAVQFQREQLCLWAMVEMDNEKVSRTFTIIGTGHPIAEAGQMKHIATVQQYGGELVWHVFEIWL